MDFTVFKEFDDLKVDLLIFASETGIRCCWAGQTMMSNWAELFPLADNPNKPEYRFLYQLLLGNGLTHDCFIKSDFAKNFPNSSDTMQLMNKTKSNLNDSFIKFKETYDVNIKEELLKKYPPSTDFISKGSKSDGELDNYYYLNVSYTVTFFKVSETKRRHYFPENKFNC